MAPRETKATVYLDRIKIFLFFFSVQKNFPVKETLSKLHKVDHFILIKEFPQK